MTCPHVGSGRNAPEGECLGFCLNKGYEVQYKNGTKLTDRETGAVFVVYNSNESLTHYQGASGKGDVRTSEVAAVFEVDGAPLPNLAEALSALDVQEGGDHYKKLGAYQPWEVLRRWLTPEEFRGYMKGTAIAYLAREQDKGGMLDIKKAGHTLQGLVELLGAE
jgi:hypothetical protein